MLLLQQTLALSHVRRGWKEGDEPDIRGTTMLPHDLYRGQLAERHGARASCVWLHVARVPAQTDQRSDKCLAKEKSLRTQVEVQKRGSTDRQS